MATVRARQGFTIVELLIVVVVIAILAAITIVSYNGITENARVSGGKSFAAQIKHRDLAEAAGYWSFDECTGSAPSNSAGSAVSSTSAVTGTANWSSDTPSGVGCSFSFNGSTYIDTAVLLSNEYYMKSAWIKTSSTSTSQNIISDIGTNNNTAFYLSSFRLNAGHNGDWNLVSDSTLLNDDKWHFVSVEFTRNGTSATGVMQLTLDGRIIAKNSSVPVMSNPSTATQLIGAYNKTNRFVGLIDDVMIITR